MYILYSGSTQYWKIENLSMNHYMKVGTFFTIITLTLNVKYKKQNIILKVYSFCVIDFKFNAICVMKLRLV